MIDRKARDVRVTAMLLEHVGQFLEANPSMQVYSVEALATTIAQQQRSAATIGQVAVQFLPATIMVVAHSADVAGGWWQPGQKPAAPPVLELTTARHQ